MPDLNTIKWTVTARIPPSHDGTYVNIDKYNSVFIPFDLLNIVRNGQVESKTEYKKELVELHKFGVIKIIGCDEQPNHLEEAIDFNLLWECKILKPQIFSYIPIIFGKFILLGLVLALLFLIFTVFQFQWPSPIIPIPETLTSIFFVTTVLYIGRIIHELGHMIALMLLGGKQSSIGIALAFGLPAAFCDVTDINRMRKLDKALVYISGVVFEGIFACTVFLIVHEMSPISAYTIAFLSIVSIVLCLIPLYRSDGYWILIDCIGIQPIFSIPPREVLYRTNRNSFVIGMFSILLIMIFSATVAYYGLFEIYFSQLGLLEFSLRIAQVLGSFFGIIMNIYILHKWIRNEASS